MARGVGTILMSHVMSLAKQALAEFDERIVIAQTLDVYRELVP